MTKTVPVLLVLLACSLVAAPGASAAASRVSGQYIVVLKQGSDQNRVVADHARKAGTDVLATYGHALKGYVAKLTPPALEAVKADARVDYVTPDYEGKPVLGKPAPPPPAWNVAQTLPTGVNRVDGDLSSARSGDQQGSVDVDVAIVDTGIDLTHPDLNVAPLAPLNCLSSSDQYYDGTNNDGYGHGTHVAGIVGAKDNTIGVVGMAPGARVWPVRVLNRVGSGTYSSQLCGIDWVTAHADTIEVANFSQASLNPKKDDGNCGLTNNDPMHTAVCRSVAAGVTWVMAAGNSQLNYSTNYVDAPMGYDEVLTATAMSDANGTPGGGGSITCRKGETDDKYASFSNWASSAADQAHTIAAPGVCINSTWKGNSYAVESGTSMAAPMTAGTAALCIASGACQHPADDSTGTPATRFTPAEITQKLRADAEAKTRASSAFGFTGDPLRPITGRYYGYLLSAAGY
ncbi:MAG: S8 family serine peptidase [Thermoleophilaceae bacterium]